MRPWYRFMFAIGIAIPTVCAFAQDSCVPTIRSAGTFQIDLSVPGRFVDVCAEDKALCRTLTAGYPASISTLAYFVLPEDWKTAKQNPRGFRRYLIAQLSGSMTPDRLPAFKQYLHSQRGQVPDHTALPAVLTSKGRASLGIVSETPDSISFGTVMKLESTSTSQNIDLASINSAIIIRDRLLSLYVFDEVRDPNAVEPLKALSERWLKCLRENNHSAR